MRLLIILLLGGIAFWILKERKSSAEAELEAVQTKAASEAQIVGRWRSNTGQMDDFRPNGSFSANRRGRQIQDDIEVDFTAGVRGKWTRQASALQLEVERVESVTVISTRPTAEAGFPTMSAADTVANRVRHTFPADYASSGAGAVLILELESLGARELRLREEGKSSSLVRVD